MSVKINIKTTINQDHHREMIELTAFGRFYQKDKAFFLQYEEAAEEESTRTIVKIAGDKALILRSGAIKMRLPFAINKETKGTYELPFGKFEAVAVAKRIEHSYDVENSKGCIDILYDFSMQGASEAGTYHLEITFQEEKQ